MSETATAERRFAALAATGLLDSGPERRFDRLTKLVAAALRVPVSLVALVDADRQFFKSAVGLAEPWAERRQTPLSHSFCRHVVESEAPLVVHDSTRTPLVAANPAVAELGVAAYLGVPIADRDGVVIGSLCAIDHVPHEWQAADLDVLTDVAVLVQREIAERRATAELAAAEHLWRNILNAMPQLVWSANANGRSNGFNLRWLEFTGMAEDCDPPRAWQDFVHDDDLVAANAAWQAALAAERPMEATFRLRHASGAYHTVLARAVPLRDETGAVQRWFASCTDIQALLDLQADNDRMKRDVVASVIDQLSARAAYLKGAEYDEVRSVIRALRQLG